MGQSIELLLDRVRSGDESAMEQLLSLHRGRLRRMIRMRLHPLVRKRVDESDILQDALLAASQRMNDFFTKSHQPFFLWLRAVTSQIISECHRFHLDAQKRSAKLDHEYCPGEDSLSQSMAHVIASRERSPADAAQQEEMRAQVREVLSSLSAPDREVLCMRHFEGLSNAEVAASMEISTSNASTRYLRALSRLKVGLTRFPGFFEPS